ncbi:MAG: DUF4863 family protein [Deltaproteobacteria bacterium]|nr:DUF4863 family protein [Deltaproteobacteria bacterium]
MNREDFAARVRPFAEAASGASLDGELERALSARFPVDGPEWRALREAVELGARAGLLLKHEAGGVRFGRVLRPSDELGGFSVDVVEMRDVVGPHHRHPEGEVDLVMPIDPGARFDGHGEGFVVYAPGSAHRPTVTEGAAYVLYLLPGGAIEFTQAG